MATLILGSSGWIGSHLVNEFGKVSKTPISSMTTRDEFKTWLDSQGTNTYINCIGRVSGSSSEMEWANVGVVESLIAHAKRTGSKILNLGSASEYGDQQGKPLHEMQSCAPKSDYGIQKLATKQLIGEFIGKGGEGVHARIFNVVGSGQKTNSALGQILRNITNLEPDSEFAVTDFDVERDYVSLDFVCRCLITLSDVGFYGTINIGSGKGTKLFEVVTALATDLGVSAVPGSLDPSRLGSAVADTNLLSTNGITPETLLPKDVARIMLHGM
jgi:nucleoside-diphosphate-sugar epimerase